MKHLPLLIAALLAVKCIASPPEDSKGFAEFLAVDMRAWKSVPCVVGRTATELDIKEARAVLLIKPVSGKVKPIDIGLPRCAIWDDHKRNRYVPVIVIQAEEIDGIQMAGFRFLSGGSGACVMKRLTLLDGPDGRFENKEPNLLLGNRVGLDRLEGESKGLGEAAH